jgi:hypothetical protein
MHRSVVKTKIIDSSYGICNVYKYKTNDNWSMKDKGGGPVWSQLSASHVE